MPQTSNMLASLALLFLIGLSLASICQKFKLPRLSGMVVTGIVLGPFVLDCIDPAILGISAQLRQIALIIILTRAGLSLNLNDLKKVGRPAVLMSFLPASLEIIGYTLFAPTLLGISRAESALLGAVMGAVSPAVVVPQMLRLMDEGYGTNKGIPQLVMAGASCDDIFVMVLFTAFLGMAKGETVSSLSFLDVPMSIVLGVALGCVVGIATYKLFTKSKDYTYRTVLMLSFSFVLVFLEQFLSGKVPVSGLLAVVAMACIVKVKCEDTIAENIRVKFSELWKVFEILLFVLVGAAVDINYAWATGGTAIAILSIGLVFRAFGVSLCLLGTPLTTRERLFCTIAYIPKATVQAAIGSVPLSIGLECGETILSVAVIGILTTAPLGAFGMDVTYKALLTRQSNKDAEILTEPS